MLQEIFGNYFKELINTPSKIYTICILYITSYYIVSILFIVLNRRGTTLYVFKKNGIVDIFTSLFWAFCSIILVVSMIYLCVIKRTMLLEDLIIYYFLFIFLFAILYGLLEWHFSGMLDGSIDTLSLKGELQYLIVSIQTQTTLGYTNVKPKTLSLELLTAIQALWGIFFMAVFISISVSKLN